MKKVCDHSRQEHCYYTKKDFTRNGETYDVIFDVIGKSLFFTEHKIPV